ncbi:MAG: TetR/AcrR family transcriptional regulator [Gemmatimonadales bacterium]
MADVALTTRDRLLEAARELFTTAGYHATTTPILAKRAGVAEGTIYRHFPSKQALLNAAYQDTQRWGAAVVRDAALGKGPALGERLAKIGRMWLEQAERDPARVRLLLTWRHPQELDEASRAAASELRQGLEHLIAHGKQEGSVRAGVVELWTAVWLTLVSFAAEKVASREWTAGHPHALATLDAAWEAIAWRPIVVGAPASVAPPGGE